MHTPIRVFSKELEPSGRWYSKIVISSEDGELILPIKTPHEPSEVELLNLAQLYCDEINSQDLEEE